MSSTLTLGLLLLCVLDLGCERCETATLESTVSVYVPHPALVPRHCADGLCEEADDSLGLAYFFTFQQSQAGFFCNYPDLPGEIETAGCDTARLSAVRAGEIRDLRRQTHVVLENCDIRSLPLIHEGDRCSVFGEAGAARRDSCGPAMYCAAPEARCRRLPEACDLDVDCAGIHVCDQHHLCVRYVCDRTTDECVWPDECADTMDCNHTHSRCDPSSGVCDTFTCETGRCVGIRRSPPS